MPFLFLDVSFDSATIPLIIMIVLVSLFLYAWIRTLMEINRSRFGSDTTRTLWILFVGFMPLLGMILYYLSGRKRRIG